MDTLRDKINLRKILKTKKFKNFRNKKILIIGASWFLGYNLSTKIKN